MSWLTTLRHSSKQRTEMPRPRYSGMKIKPGELFISYHDDRLLEMPPFVNELSRPPSWFRSIGKFPGSVRRCAGISDYMAMGVTLPLWTNIRMKLSPEGNDWSVNWDNLSETEVSKDQYEFYVRSFAHEQTGKCPMTSVRQVEESFYPKIVTPYYFRTAPGWSTIILPNLYEPSPNFTVTPAVIHTDFYHTMNVVLNPLAGEDFSIPYGYPIAHLIPFKRSADTNKIIFGGPEYHRLLVGRGFGNGSLHPSGGSTARPYRMHKVKVDAEIAEKEGNRD